MTLGFLSNSEKRARRKAWKDEVERGKRIKKAQLIEIKRRTAEEKARLAETKRSTEIERLRKRTELLRAQAAEREAVSRRRRARQAAGIGRLISPPRPKVPKALKRKRGRKAKIGWF